MIPPQFIYRRASSAEEARSLVAEYGDEAKFLAGGHSLLPLMKLRLAQPEVLVDLAHIRELSYIRAEPDHIAIGALTRYHDLQHSKVLAEELPLLAYASGGVGDPQVRHRGTIGGSIAHGDSAADIPAVVLALDGTLVVAGPSGVREVPSGEFFRGPFETALEPDELLTEIRLPRPASRAWAFQKLTNRAIDWAIVGVAVQGGSIGLVNMGSTPLRATATERALAEGASIADAAAQAAEGTSPFADTNASSRYREHLVRVLVRRALEQAGSR
jgi:carbon-monoxide dehydrogenase medium subunit